ncbi:BsuPI-related putative proteinase inhibitor [Bacillus sp. AFS041924]|uniref:BsuPI-related putative proteinase inhibitor n=1 Tax=Bacillus sp. AFS041924 TaxID=2033503 RepID=UPI000BFB6BE3|nr:BsuPI-related putative proteinase inhibitor [Bacillus sp. AFS041924]PGS51610.1 hypothetical protein COC46_11485 [Bacillus sp. AFS041924]
MLTITLLCSCTQSIVSDKKESRIKTQGIAYLGIEATLKSVEDKGGKNFIFTLKNQNDYPVKLVFSSSLEYDYKIKNQEGNVVKQRSLYIASVPKVKNITLKQAEELVYIEDYDQLIEGLPMNSYTVEFNSTAKSENISAAIDFEIK